MIDAHHHIWLQKDLPWLLGPEQPRIFGTYGPIKRDYPMAEFLDDLSGTGITKSVYVQVNWAPERALDEVRWVQSIAEEHGCISAIIGYADLTVDDVRPQLEALSEFPLMRGIRQQMHWHENPQYRFAANAKVIAEPNVRRNIAYLADYGWSFDLQVFSGQMEDAARLADACPDVPFILQHSGMLEEDAPHVKSAWLDGINRLAECPNIYNKLSAFGTFIHRNDPDMIAQMIQTAVEVFGSNRCMYGSNFPIEKIWTDYRSLFRAFVKGSEQFSREQRDDIFNNTAKKIYRL